MNYKIVDKEAFSIFGVESIVTTENGENLRQIPEIWTKAFAEGTIDRIIDELDQPISSTGISPVNAVMCYRETGGMTFPYMLYANMPLGGAPEGYTSVEIPALTWVIFTTVEYTKDQTTEQVQLLWKRIFSEWFPVASYEQVHGPQFEIYGTAESGKEYCEVWIPVVKK